MDDLQSLNEEQQAALSGALFIACSYVLVVFSFSLPDISLVTMLLLVVGAVIVNLFAFSAVKGTRRSLLFYVFAGVQIIFWTVQIVLFILDLYTHFTT